MNDASPRPTLPGLPRTLDMEGARARLEERRLRFEEMAAQTQAMADQMQVLRASATDPNGLVTVSVDSTGNLTGIELSARSQRVQPEAVSRAIMDTVAEAKRRIAEQTGEVIAATVGADSETGKAVAANLKARFGSNEEQEPRR